MSFTNKKIVVTGGGRGIGRSTAELFVESGADVIIVSRTQNQIQEVCESINQKNYSGSISFRECDVSKAEEVKNLFLYIEKTWGKLDVLVNNAGVILNKPFVDTDTEEWDLVMNINLRGMYLTSREAFKLMGKQKTGCIVQVSSLGGIKGTEKFPGFSAYTVSKHGVVGLTEALAVEGKPLGIRVNAVAPGAVSTEMLRQAAPSLQTSTEPVDVARVIKYLSDSVQAKSLNGAIVEIHSNE